LSDDLGELLRTVFAGQDGVTHEGEASIIRDGRLMRDATKITKYRGSAGLVGSG
jgi:hypothetical protein